MYRVLKPGGIALIIDLRKDFGAQDVNDYVRGKGVINAALIKLTFNTMLKKRAYTRGRYCAAGGAVRNSGMAICA